MYFLAILLLATAVAAKPVDEKRGELANLSKEHEGQSSPIPDDITPKPDDIKPILLNGPKEHEVGKLPDNSKEKIVDEPEKGGDSKKEEDTTESKKPDDFQEPDQDKKNGQHSEKIKKEHGNGDQNLPNGLDVVKPSKLSNVLNWLFNLFPFNRLPFISHSGSRSGYEQEPDDGLVLEPSDQFTIVN